MYVKKYLGAALFLATFYTCSVWADEVEALISNPGDSGSIVSIDAASHGGGGHGGGGHGGGGHGGGGHGGGGHGGGGHGGGGHGGGGHGGGGHGGGGHGGGWGHGGGHGWGGHYPWHHWDHPYFARPLYYWEWDRLRLVTCTSEDGSGRPYPVTEDGFYGYGYRGALNNIEDAALDKCFEESGGDGGCRLMGCYPGY